MRKLFLFVWLLVPVAAGAYHYGPGQDRMRADRAAEAVSRAEAAALEARATAAKSGDDAARASWAEAEEAYGEAIELLPQGSAAEGRRLRLERAKAQMFVGKLPDARRDLASLVDEISGDPKPDATLLDESRAALANAQYYSTWLLRLGGASREDVESAVRLERMDLADLQGLPLPSQ